MMSNGNCCINIDLIGLLFLMRLKVVVQLDEIERWSEKGKEAGQADS